MQSYVNKFNIAINPDNNELIINFMQECPKFEDMKNDTLVTIKTAPEIEEVAKLVMTEPTARTMVNLIQQLLENRKKSTT